MSDATLVLGASGFIGRHLPESFASTGNAVIAATRQAATFTHSNISNVAAPFDESGHVTPLLERCRWVIHAPSISTPGSSAAKPQLDGNLRTTLALIEALHDACAPTTQYGGRAVVLQPSNICGHGQPACRGFGIIPTVFDCALHSAPLTIWGDDTTVRDYVYIDEFIALCDAALARPLDGGARVFNAASGEPGGLDALIDRIDAVTGRPLQRLYHPADRVDIRSITADTTAARATFDWYPATTLEEGLHRTWQ